MAEQFYRVLGVPKGAPEKEIKSAYRRLARELHPDINPGDRAAEARFKKVNEAYDVIGDHRKRKDYDEFGEHWRHAGELRKAGGAGRFARSGQHGAGSMSDLFSDQNGGGIFDRFGQGAHPRRSSAELNVDITLAEAFSGATRRVNIGGPGGGRTIEVTIPAGIRDGGRVRLTPDPSLELLITVRTLPHSTFSRKGDDLLADVRTPLLTAVLGGEAEVQTLTGRVALTIPPGTQNGRSFRIPGKGMPRRGSGKFGDLIATVKIRLPEKLSTDQMRLFEQLKEIESGATADGSTDGPTGGEK